MWTTSNGYSRAPAGVAAAGVIAMAAGGVTAVPAAAQPGIVPPASAMAPVELTALTSDSSLMDIIGELTGLSTIMAFLDDPNSPLFPFAVGAEALGEIFVIMPLVLVIGAPLMLITEGPSGLADFFNDLSSITDGVNTLFDGIKDWYATHNPFTGALLDAGSSAAVDLSGWEHAFTAGSWDDVFTAGGFDAMLTDFGLGDLIA